MLGLEIEIIKETDNKFLNRVEYEFIIKHEGGPTPSRVEVFKELVNKLSIDPEKSVLIYIKTLLGKNTSNGLLYYYPDGIDWSTIEPPHRRKVIKIGEEESKEKGEEA